MTFTFSTPAYDVIVEAADLDAAFLAYVNESGYASVTDAAEALNQTEDDFRDSVIVTVAE